MDAIPWFTLLSARLLRWLLGTILAMLAIAGVGFVVDSAPEEGGAQAFTTDMTIQAIAPEIGVTGVALAKELGENIGKPHTINEITAGQPPFRNVYRAMAKEAALGGEDTIAPGEIIIQAKIEISFELK